MAKKEYLIDTNAVIDYLSETIPQKALLFMDKVVDSGYSISVINMIELYAYSNLNKKDKASLDIFTSKAILLYIDNDIIQKTIKIRKIYKTKLPDAIIAATAIVNKLTLISRNTKDFDAIKGLEVVNPHEI